MRIEIVTDTFAPDVNGVAMTLGRITDALRKQGHYVHVIHTAENSETGQTTKKSIPIPGYKEVRIGLPSPFKFRARWKTKRPDAIYVATESPLGISAIKVARDLNIPVIGGFHTNFHQYLKKYNLGKLEDFALSYLKKVHDKCDATLVPSQQVLEILEQNNFHNVKLLGRGVDTQLFSPSKRSALLRSSWGVEPDTPVCIIVGRVAPEKNLELGIHAINKLREKNPNIKGVIVGDGPIRKRLMESHPHIHFAGMQTGEELAKHYASADILLFPSITETFGNVLIEGMASGLVTVSYDYAASKVYVENGVNGFQASTPDEDDFIAKSHDALVHFQDQDIKDQALKTVRSLCWDSIAETFHGYLKEAMLNKPVTSRRVNKKQKFKVRSLFLSDIHLGTTDSKAREVVEVIKNTDCEYLYLNGDIIDGWALDKGSKWRKSHTKCLRTILKKSETDCQVIYIRGNHDDFLTQFLPVTFGSIDFAKEKLHTTPDGKKYLVIHGDGFDSVCTNHKWLASLGSFGYDFLLRVNNYYNKYRAWRGKEYFSLSKAVKAKVKSAVTFVDKYEDKLHGLANSKGYDGIIAGHIHTAADKMIDNTHYLNSGDWVESLTAVVEFHDGTFKVMEYAEILEHLEGKKTGTTDSAAPSDEAA